MPERQAEAVKAAVFAKASPGQGRLTGLLHLLTAPFILLLSNKVYYPEGPGRINDTGLSFVLYHYGL